MDKSVNDISINQITNSMVQAVSWEVDDYSAS
jgi:hypothetical protein